MLRSVLELTNSIGHHLKGIYQPGHVTADFGEIVAQITTHMASGKVGKLFDWQKNLAIKKRADRTDGKDQYHTAEDDHAVLKLTKGAFKRILGDTNVKGAQQALVTIMKVTGRVKTLRFIINRGGDS
jgi:hypothetical protein